MIFCKERTIEIAWYDSQIEMVFYVGNIPITIKFIVDKFL